MLQKKAIILWQKMLGPDWWKVARGWEADWWQGSMASCHSTSVAAPSGRWIGSEWQKLVGPDCEDRQQHERQIPGESISLSLWYYADKTCGGGTVAARCLPPISDEHIWGNFGSLGNRNNGGSGCAPHWPHWYSWVQPVGQTTISPNMNSGHSTSDMRASRQSTVNRCQLGMSHNKAKHYYGFYVPVDQMISKQYWVSVGPGSVGPRKPKTEHHCFKMWRSNVLSSG